MIGELFIPYANGDCVKGFSYDKPITKEEYVKMQVKEWKDHKDGVNQMMPQLGYNIAINPWQKRHFDYTQQTYYFHNCEAYLCNAEDDGDMTLPELDAIYRKGKIFMVNIHLNPKMVKNKPDLQTDLRQWLDESMKLWGLNGMEIPDSNTGQVRIMNEEEILKHLPKKDFKFKVKEDNSTAVLKDCRLIECLDESFSYMLMVTKIFFVKE